MTLLPIVERELRVGARRRRTYSSRIRVGFLSTIFGVGSFTAYNYTGFGLGGGTLFGSVAFFVFLFCLLGGVQMTFDCLSEEKRAGTLGLLFLTDLKGYDIVLGKLLATSLTTFYGLMAAFPVLAILIPLGKVQPGEFSRVVLTLLNTLFFSLSLGMMCSAISRKQQRAMSAALLGVLFFWLGLPGAAELLRRFHFPEPLYLLCDLLSPAGAQRWALATTYGLRSNYFWWSLLSTHLLAWSFLGLASVVLPRVWQEKASGPSAMRWRERFKQWGYGSAITRTAFRQRLIAVTPLYWLFARDRLRPLWVWVFLAAEAAGATLLFYFAPAAYSNPALPAMFTVAATLVVKFWAGSDASRGLAEEKWQGTLEGLFCAPLTAREIARGQWQALRRQFGWPVLTLFGLQIFVLFFGRSLLENPEETRLWTWGSLGYIGTAWLDFWALGWMGIWAGLTAKNPKAASGTAAVRVVFLPPAIVYLFFAALAIYSGLGLGRFDPTPIQFLSLWLGLGLLNSLGWGWWARRQLFRRMRLEAMRYFAAEESTGSWWPFRRVKESPRGKPAVAVRSA